MPQPNDLSRSPIALNQDGTLIAVIEMSRSSWLVTGVIPGIDRHPLKKLEPDEEGLLRLLRRWQDEAARAGRTISRMAVAFEAGHGRAPPAFSPLPGVGDQASRRGTLRTCTRSTQKTEVGSKPSCSPNLLKSRSKLPTNLPAKAHLGLAHSGAGSGVRRSQSMLLQGGCGDENRTRLLPPVSVHGRL